MMDNAVSNNPKKKPRFKRRDPRKSTAGCKRGADDGKGTSPACSCSFHGVSWYPEGGDTARVPPAVLYFHLIPEIHAPHLLGPGTKPQRSLSALTKESRTTSAQSHPPLNPLHCQNKSTKSHFLTAQKAALRQGKNNRFQLMGRGRTLKLLTSPFSTILNLCCLTE